ncbi:MAG: cyclase family protein [Phycisphaeraceae bacterium]|nr:cyclase family protein [Phycisphaeraceae bacterium]
MKKTPAKPMTRAEFDALFKKVCNWGRWGEDDERGTLNYITPRHITGAAKLVRSGRTVSLAIPINTVAGPDNPNPAVHKMVVLHDTAWPEGEPRFATDSLDSQFHGDCFTHMDALCHVSYQGKLYNGKPADSVTKTGATLQDITAFAHGIVGRGVLLDIPRLRGVKWLELGDAVTAEELEAAEKAQGVRLGEGDIMLFRTGHHRRRLELGPWNPGYSGLGMAGLHASSMLMLHERKVAVFLPDGDGETVPSNVEGIACPIHTLQLVAMGMVCADSLQFEELVEVCEQEKRWEFMVSASPLRLPRATGSMFNPTAIF